MNAMGRYMAGVFGYGISTSLLFYLMFREVGFIYMIWAMMPIFNLMFLPLSYSAKPYYNCNADRHNFKPVLN